MVKKIGKSVLGKKKSVTHRGKQYSYYRTSKYPQEIRDLASKCRRNGFSTRIVGSDEGGTHYELYIRKKE